MRGLLLAAAAAAAALLSASPASANCRTAPFRFQFGQAEPTRAAVEADRAGCSHRYRAGGRSIFTSAAIVRSPRHGTLTQRESFNFLYKPSVGFAGADGYAVKICGQGLAGSGCAVIDYAVEVK